jgi:hypothetical protein
MSNGVRCQLNYNVIKRRYPAAAAWRQAASQEGTVSWTTHPSSTTLSPEAREVQHGYKGDTRQERKATTSLQSSCFLSSSPNLSGNLLVPPLLATMYPACLRVNRTTELRSVSCLVLVCGLLQAASATRVRSKGSDTTARRKAWPMAWMWARLALESNEVRWWWFCVILTLRWLRHSRFLIESKFKVYTVCFGMKHALRWLPSKPWFFIVSD